VRPALGRKRVSGSHLDRTPARITAPLVAEDAVQQRSLFGVTPTSALRRIGRMRPDRLDSRLTRHSVGSVVQSIRRRLSRKPMAS
jgi:hypothetical protein